MIKVKKRVPLLSGREYACLDCLLCDHTGVTSGTSEGRVVVVVTFVVVAVVDVGLAVVVVTFVVAVVETGLAVVVVTFVVVVAETGLAVVVVTFVVVVVETGFAVVVVVLAVVVTVVVVVVAFGSAFGFFKYSGKLSFPPTDVYA